MMTRDDILRMAREAQWLGNIEGWTFNSYDELERFFRLAYKAGAAAERERIIAANAPEIERINAHIKELEQARLEEREACARVCEGRLQEGLNFEGCAAAIRARGQPDPKITHLNEWARDRLARHGINPCPDCHGIGYDASGQLCACQENPSF
jgi:hypothetical protein